VEVRWRGSLSWGRGRGRGTPPPRGRTSTWSTRRRSASWSRTWRCDRPRAAPHRDGAVDPVVVTDALVRAAQSHGTRLVVGCTATALRPGRRPGDRGRHLERLPLRRHGCAGRRRRRTGAVRALGFSLPVAPSPALLMRFAGPPDWSAPWSRRLTWRSVRAQQVSCWSRRPTTARRPGRAGPRRDGRCSSASPPPSRTRRTCAWSACGSGARPMPADGLPFVGPVPGCAGRTSR
jgi:hypothetical protein